MSGMIAIESQLSAIVKEYLSYYGFDMTLNKFNEECSNKGLTAINLERAASSSQKASMIIKEMVNLYNQGQSKEFFRRWIENVPIQKIENDLAAQKLELELNIHFAVYPFRIGGRETQVQSKESMNVFKNYIENKGRVLCQTKEFLPYFGLPYHQNPEEVFPELFSKNWMIDLGKKLEDFLKESLNTQNPPRLVELLGNQPNEADVKLKQQLLESEKRTMAFMRKFNKVQADYHSLIGITAELVDSLESTISGKPVSPEYIQNICYKLFNTQLKQSIDFTRPGTAGDYIRKSLAYQKIAPEKSEIRNNYPPLDFLKIKSDLINQNEKRQLLLLQALRWRLTKAETVEIRQRFLTAYITGDLLNCRSERVPNNMIELLKSPSLAVREYMARLINSFASLNHGRSYLASNLELVKTMHFVLRNEKEDNFIRKNLLAALQKLSLRHRLQILMINDNVIDLLINLLENNETLSDYSLEYAIALFMNLTLKNAGKKKCVNDCKRVLDVISDLLGNSNTEIQAYVNGALYNILSVPSIRTQAKSMNLETILKGYLVDGTVEINQQRELIIEKISSNEEKMNEDTFENEEDEDDEEDAEMMEFELDSGEAMIKQSPDDLFGESLLVSEYSINNNNNNNSNNEQLKNRPKQSETEFLKESSVLSRPITPSHLRQSQHFTNKPPPNNKDSLVITENVRNNPKRSVSNGNLNAKDTKAQTQAIDSGKKTPYKQSLSAGSRKDGKADILVIESKEVDDFLAESNQNYTNGGKTSTNDSLTLGFSTKQKIPRTPDNYSYARKNSITNNSVNSSFTPKYSITEPRPSSANSTKSKNSISTGTQNDNSQYYNGSTVGKK